jgi:hypothetical protein
MSVSIDAPKTPRPTTRPNRARSATADVLFDAFFGGGFGGSAIALFFLLVDPARGEAFFTPSVMGTALFTSEPVSASTPVDLQMIAFYSLVHFLVFGALGASMSLLTRQSPYVDRHPLAIAGAVFAVLTAGLVVADLLVLHGVITAIGIVPILAANAITGLTMAVFFRWSHNLGR